MLFKRIKAAVVDVALMVLVIFLLDAVFANVSMSSNTPKAIALFLLFFAYDPMTTAFSGGTVGHHVMGITVKREGDEEQNISFPSAIIRFLIKYLLGWISLLTIAFSSRSKAIHDMAVSSVVTYKPIS